MLHFILNNKTINTAVAPSTTVLDFVRYHQNLTGTKIGCREGDCGACSVLVGECTNDGVVYKSATSCLMPLANARGKHVVTIEGINDAGLTPVQRAFADEGATQCGFCTPGFVVALTGYCLGANEETASAVDAMNGNICRCTGYKSIIRAAATVTAKLKQRRSEHRLQFAMEQGFVPAYFKDIHSRLSQLPAAENGMGITSLKKLAGGTDLYVQQHETLQHEELDFLFDRSALKGIVQHENVCSMGAGITVTDMLESRVFQQHFAHLPKYIKLLSSTPIRNMATIAGNFTNASPIGDLTIFFLALNAQLILQAGDERRTIPLRQYYRGYKMLNKRDDEIIDKVFFDLPGGSHLFNFEKVCKRTHLDIASVNSAVYLEMSGDTILSGSLSAGGVRPVPLYLASASAFLTGKRISAAMIRDLIQISQSEIAPISDARGSTVYKRLLLSQLIKAHFIELFPALPLEQILTAG